MPFLIEKTKRMLTDCTNKPFDDMTFRSGQKVKIKERFCLRVDHWWTNEGQQLVWNLLKCNWHPHCHLTNTAVDLPLLWVHLAVMLKRQKRNSILFLFGFCFLSDLLSQANDSQWFENSQKSLILQPYERIDFWLWTLMPRIKYGGRYRQIRHFWHEIQMRHFW